MVLVLCLVFIIKFSTRVREHEGLDPLSTQEVNRLGIESLQEMIQRFPSVLANCSGVRTGIPGFRTRR